MFLLRIIETRLKSSAKNLLAMGFSMILGLMDSSSAISCGISSRKGSITMKPSS